MAEPTVGCRTAHRRRRRDHVVGAARPRSVRSCLPVSDVDADIIVKNQFLAVCPRREQWFLGERKRYIPLPTLGFHA